MKFIKRYESYEDEKIFSKQFQEFLLIVGEKSEDMFIFFGVDEMHGVSRSEARKKIDTNKGAYIAGFCNEFPLDPSKYFLFINATRFNDTYDDYLTIMHETMHLSFLIKGINVEANEEEIITFGEEKAREICGILKQEGYIR